MMRTSQLSIYRLDHQLARWSARHSVRLLSIGLGVVYLWFGALKIVPGLSPADDLALRTVDALTLGLMPEGPGRVLLASLECAIGLGFLTGRHLRATLALMAFQMAGALSPLVLFPGAVFDNFVLAPTLEGQYIIKNLVLISAALVILATLPNGRIAEPAAREVGDSRER